MLLVGPKGVGKKTLVIVSNIFLLSFQFFACAQNNISLKEKFSSLFFIGAVINQEDYQILDKDPKIIEIVQGDFNALTPENSILIR